MPKDHPIKRLIKMMFYAVIVFIVFSLVIFFLSIRPSRYISNNTPETFNLNFEEVSLDTSDELKLSAWYVPAKRKSNKTIIVMHGYPADKGDALGAVTFLHNEFNLFLFDFRYFGESEGSYTSVGYHEQRDLDAAIAYLNEHYSDHNLGIYSYSLGAITTILRKTNDVKAIVADSIVEDIHALIHAQLQYLYVLRHPFVWGIEGVACLTFGTCPMNMSLVKNVKEIHIPIYFIHGEKDDLMPYEGAQKVFDAANEPKKWWLVPRAGHIQSQAMEQESYQLRVTEFYKKWL